jgi:hypothetical protein
MARKWSKFYRIVSSDWGNAVASVFIGERRQTRKKGLKWKAAAEKNTKNSNENVDFEIAFLSGTKNQNQMIIWLNAICPNALCPNALCPNALCPNASTQTALEWL